MQDAAATVGEAGEERSAHPPPVPRPVDPEPGRAESGALASVPWRHRLSTQLLLVGGGLVLAAVTAFTLTEFYIARQRLEGVVSSTEVLSEGIKGAVSKVLNAAPPRCALCGLP